MRKATTRFISADGSDFFYGKPTESKVESEETYDQHKDRTWPEKVHIDDRGIFIQPFALKNALEAAGKWLSIKIKGEGHKTYTARLRQGALVVDKMHLENEEGRQLTIEDVEPITLFVPSDGKRGGSKRVFRVFPRVKQWRTTATIYLMDDKISEDVLAKHLECIGQFIGFGAMRTENGGINGRFTVDSLDIKTVS